MFPYQIFLFDTCDFWYAESARVLGIFWVHFDTLISFQSRLRLLTLIKNILPWFASVNLSRMPVYFIKQHHPTLRSLCKEFLSFPLFFLLKNSFLYQQLFMQGEYLPFYLNASVNILVVIFNQRQSNDASIRRSNVWVVYLHALPVSITIYLFQLF